MPIGEMGGRLSGGEKQRLSIARALRRQPPLRVFDGATSALDSLTGEQTTDSVRRRSTESKHTTVLIAHRLSTILHAQTIFVLKKGCIGESGNHADLLSQRGLYCAIWRPQIGERPVPLVPERPEDLQWPETETQPNADPTPAAVAPTRASANPPGQLQNCPAAPGPGAVPCAAPGGQAGRKTGGRQGNAPTAAGLGCGCPQRASASGLLPIDPGATAD